MSNKEKIRFAMIGCGRVSKKHIEVLNNLPNAELIAACDLDEAKACKSLEGQNVSIYTNYHEMLQKENVDVVNVLTESGSHAKIVIDIAKYKRHIVVEKPMALTLEDADAMIRVCDENNVKLFVVKQNRYNLSVQKLREAIETKRFGKLVMGTIRLRWCREQAYYDQAEWRGTWAHDGGVFCNQASHHIDLLEWMMGDVESVFAKTETMLADIETEDTGVVILKFANGALGVIEATTATRPVDLEGSISIMGEQGTVEIGGFAVNKMKVWNFKTALEGDSEIFDKYSENPKTVYGFGHYEYLRHVIECIGHRETALVDGLEGRRSLELINAIYESSETGKEVFLRFKPKRCKLGTQGE